MNIINQNRYRVRLFSLYLMVVSLLSILFTTSCDSKNSLTPTRFPQQITFGDKGEYHIDKDYLEFQKPIEAGTISDEVLQLTITNNSDTAVRPNFGYAYQNIFPADAICFRNDIQPGGSCVLNFRFAPEVNGTFTDRLTVTINGKYAYIDIKGVSTIPAGIKNLTVLYSIDTPDSITDIPEDKSFKKVLGDTIATTDTELGAISLSKIYIKIQNVSTKVGKIQFTQRIEGSSYRLDNTTCGESLDSKEICYTEIIFAPNLEGDNIARYRIKSGNSNALLILKGSGMVMNPLTATGVLINRKAISFPDTLLEELSEPLTISIKYDAKDNKPVPLTIDFPKTADYKPHRSSCLDTLKKGEKCDISLYFYPTKKEKRSDQIIINGANIDLIGNGIVAPIADNKTTIPNLEINKKSHNFNKIAIGSISPSGKFILSAVNGDVNVRLANISAPFAFATEYSTCTFANNNEIKITAGRSCELAITFIPTYIGVVKGDLTLTSGIGDNEVNYNIGMSGEGYKIIEPIIFNFVNIGSSDTKSFTYVNYAISPVEIGNVIVDNNSDRVFEILNDNCKGKKIQSGDFCNIDIKFSPTDRDKSYNKILLIRSSSGKELIRVTIIGASGIAKFIKLTPTGIVQLTSDSSESMVAYNNAIYAIGGTRSKDGAGYDSMREANTKLHRYDIATNTWSILTPANEFGGPSVAGTNPQLANALVTAGMEIYDNKLILFSGRVDMNDSNVYAKMNLLSSYDFSNTRLNPYGAWESLLTYESATRYKAVYGQLGRSETAVSRVGKYIYSFGGLVTNMYIDSNGTFIAKQPHYLYGASQPSIRYDLSIKGNKDFTVVAPEFASDGQISWGALNYFFAVSRPSSAVVDDFIYVYGGDDKGSGHLYQSNTLTLYRPLCEPDKSIQYDKSAKFVQNGDTTVEASYISEIGTAIPESINTTILGFDTVGKIKGRIYFIGGNLGNALYELEVTKTNPKDNCSKVTARWRVVAVPTDIILLPSAKLVNLNGKLWIHNGADIIHFIP